MNHQQLVIIVLRRSKSIVIFVPVRTYVINFVSQSVRYRSIILYCHSFDLPTKICTGTYVFHDYPRISTVLQFVPIIWSAVYLDWLVHDTRIISRRYEILSLCVALRTYSSTFSLSQSMRAFTFSQ